MLDFLDLFMDVFLYPMRPEVNQLADNPLAAGMVCILLASGFIIIVSRLYRGLFH